MSWLSNLFHGKLPTEADVINFLAKVHTDEEVAYTWIATNGPTIIKDIQIVMAVVQTLAAGDPRVAVAVTGVNIFVTALNAMILAKAANEDLFQAINDAYQALKKMQSSTAQAALAVA